MNINKIKQPIFNLLKKRNIIINKPNIAKHHMEFVPTSDPQTGGMIFIEQLIDYKRLEL